MSNVLRNQRGNFLSWAEKAPWLDDMSGMFIKPNKQTMVYVEQVQNFFDKYVEQVQFTSICFTSELLGLECVPVLVIWYHYILQSIFYTTCRKSGCFCLLRGKRVEREKVSYLTSSAVWSMSTCPWRLELRALKMTSDSLKASASIFTAFPAAPAQNGLHPQTINISSCFP